MVGYLFIGTLAAFGLLSMLWAVFGWLLPGGRGGMLVYPFRSGESAQSFVRRYLWLRGMGLISWPLILIDLGITGQEQAWLARSGIEICSLEELPDRLGIGAETT